MTPAPTPPSSRPVLTHPEYRKAFTACTRRETRKADGSVRQRAGSLSYLAKATMSRVVVRYNAVDCPAPTACWRWDDGKHLIQVNPELPQHFLDDDKSLPSRRIDLAKAAVTHEVCHGLYTSRSGAVAAESARAKVPFRLLNLMEDCRIEWKYVKERGKEFKFGWQTRFPDRMVLSTDPVYSPMHWLLTMKQREPITFKALSSVMSPYTWAGSASISCPVAPFTHPMKLLEGVDCQFKRLVNRFYQAIVEAETTEALIPIAAYWVLCFGHEETSSLPPILVHTVPGTIGDTVDPAEPGAPGSASTAESASREAMHAPVTGELGGMQHIERASIDVDRVMHYNTDEYIKQRPRPGLVPLAIYVGELAR